MTSREQALALDAADLLASYRARLVHDDAEPELVYLDGNSLGRLPVGAADAMRRVVEQEWGSGLIRSWGSTGDGRAWVDEPQRVGDVIGTGVLGARAGEVLVCDSTTVNLYKLAAAALDEHPGRGTVLVEDGAFPTDRYVLDGLAAARGLRLATVASDPVEGVGTDAVAAALDAAAGDVALLSLSAVDYRSGARTDLATVTALAARHGVRVLWDLSHASGAVEVGLAEAGAELAVGCTYKYLHGGPGAPAFLYVRRDLQELLRSPIQGWFGQADQFAMGTAYEPVAGIGRFAAGTPPVTALALVDAGARLVAEAGIGRVAARSAALTALIVELADDRLAPLGFRLATPRDPARRGGHVSLAHPQSWQVCQALVARGVVPDFRRPDLVRLGPGPLGTRFVEVWDGIDRLATLVADGEHEAYDAMPGRVT